MQKAPSTHHAITKLGECEKEVFTVNTPPPPNPRNCCPSTPRRRAEESKKATITGYFRFAFSLRKSRSGKSLDYCEDIVCKKLRFENVFAPHWNEKLAFSNSSGLGAFSRSVFFRSFASRYFELFLPSTKLPLNWRKPENNTLER